MLQVKDLVKCYKTKGETVYALNGVSVNFPERGMVFLLGKSGSGKSTLLNVSGGLDSPDAGEIIVKGKSSKDFSQDDFDSYRNTYVGFIFQEYNILNEFTVAENVALALELQGKPRDPELIADLLRQVDLAGLGDRRPNTLSGGQKQRVAIARALVKNPEIIMADEPTGALDSATGKQVFDTLKKLSKEKLVVIVSHDREFAEEYADRIIELRDGNIISDVTRGEGEAVVRSNLTEISEKKLGVTCGATLSDEEIARVCAFLKNGKGSFIISSDVEDVVEVEQKESAGFCQTVEAPARSYTKDESQFIKSKFPLRHAVKMGISGLKFKPLRLVFTMLLSTIAFIVFGVFSTLMTYSEAKVGAKTLQTSDYGAAVLTKNAIFHMKNDAGKYTVKMATSKNAGAHFSPTEIDVINRNYPTMGFIPAYDFNQTLSFAQAAQSRDGSTNEFYKQSDFYYAMSSFTAFASVEDIRDNENFTLVEGKYPERNNEALVSKKVFETFRQFGYNVGAGNVNIENYSDLIGKEIPLPVLNSTAKIRIQVVGILDTHEEFPSFEDLKTREAGNVDLAHIQKRVEKLRDVFKYSMASLAFVPEGFYELYEQFDADVDNSLENLLNRYQSMQGGWWRATFEGTNYTEDIEWYHQYLFAPIMEGRTAKCNTLMNKINDVVDETNDLVYVAPYVFVNDIGINSQMLDQISLILGIAASVLAVFAALLLFNFILASINAKKKDIGILRAVGARGIDVFKIFMVEGIAVTLICFILGCIGSMAACAIVNNVLTAKGILGYRFFLFDWLNALIVLGISFVSALVATLIPVVLNVRKKPVEAIRSI